MKFLNTRLKKVIFWILVSIIALVILVIAFISPLTKYMIEKYDVKYTGREITLDRAYVNPFTGYISLKNLTIYEYQSDSLFLSTTISVNFEILKLLSKTYEVSSVTLDNPIIRVVQNEKRFNFDDVVEKFSSKDTISKEPEVDKEPTHLNVLNMKIRNGTFYYIEKSIPINYFIKEVNIESDGLRWNSDSLKTTFAFVSGVGKGGSMKGHFDMNLKTLDYRLQDVVDKFDLSALEQYVKDIANYGRLRATLDADIVAVGNFKKAEEINAEGLLSINDFHLGKDLHNDFVAFKKLTLDMIQLAPANKLYLFDSISLVNPYFKYERYDHLDNLQYMFGQQGEKVAESAGNPQKVNILFQIGGYIQQLAKNFFRSDYKVKRLAIYDADVRYYDYALTEKFSVGVSPLTIIADSIERGDRWVNLTLRTDLQPYGHLSFDLSINPRDSSDFNFQYHLWRVPMAWFNPYLITYTSFPLDRGLLEFKGYTNVKDGIVNSKNNLVIIDPRVNSRQKRNGAKWLPLRFFMFFVRERGNVIDYEIPIAGDLKNPNFKFKDIIFDVLENIFVKPVTVPYRTEVRNVENEIEKSLTLKWVMRKSELNPPQEKFIKKMADFLEDNPNAFIVVKSELYTEREKEYILFFETKKQFYLSSNKMSLKNLSDRDSARIEKLSIKDSTFTYYLNRKAGRDLHTVQEKCKRVIKETTIDQKLKQLTQARKNLFLSYFKEKGVDGRVKMEAAKSTVPFNGFSLYRINYKGEFPDYLLEAYEDINDLDNNSPRNKFKEERSRSRKYLDAK